MMFRQLSDIYYSDDDECVMKTPVNKFHVWLGNMEKPVPMVLVKIRRYNMAGTDSKPELETDLTYSWSLNGTMEASFGSSFTFLEPKNYQFKNVAQWFFKDV